MADVEVVVAHAQRATLRVGDVYLKVDADQSRTDVEVMATVPVPTPRVLWRKPPVLALAAVPGAKLGRLGEPSPASPAAWAAAGAAVRALHDAPPPPWRSGTFDGLAARVAGECEWLVANDVVPADVVARNRRLAETAFRPFTPVFIHGDLQVDHVFVAGNEVTGIIDWSEGGQGDASFDLATLTLGHPEHLGDVVAGYSSDVDLDLVRACWSLRCLSNSAGWSSTATARPRTTPRWPCCCRRRDGGPAGRRGPGPPPAAAVRRRAGDQALPVHGVLLDRVAVRGRVVRRRQRTAFRGAGRQRAGPDGGAGRERRGARRLVCLRSAGAIPRRDRRSEQVAGAPPPQRGPGRPAGRLHRRPPGPPGPGVVGPLVRGAVSLARENGATAIEAWPLARGVRSPGDLHVGREGVFARSGFRCIQRPDAERTFMRLDLTEQPS